MVKDIFTPAPLRSMVHIERETIFHFQANHVSGYGDTRYRAKPWIRLEHAWRPQHPANRKCARVKRAALYRLMMIGDFTFQYLHA